VRRIRHSLRHGVVAALAVATAWDGAGFAFGPARWSSTSALHIVRVMHAVRPLGLAMLVLSLLLAVGLRRGDWRIVELAAPALIALQVALAFSIFYSWVTVGITSWGAPARPLLVLADGRAARSSVLAATRRPPPDRR
jgi:hypothetical protein